MNTSRCIRKSIDLYLIVAYEVEELEEKNGVMNVAQAKAPTEKEPLMKAFEEMRWTVALLSSDKSSFLR